MSLLGTAALAMWWDITADMRTEFEDWHSHEHFPERLRIPGFRRASRWASADGGEGFFVLYELDSHATLSSAAYLARLNAPTRWSTKIMPHHRNMVRSQCRIVASRGSALATHALTWRPTVAPGREADVRTALTALADDVATRAGIVGAHVLQHDVPDVEQTTEQKIRGGNDTAADWALIACGYDLRALEALARADLEAPRRAAMSAAGVSGFYTLSHSASATDFA